MNQPRRRKREHLNQACAHAQSDGVRRCDRHPSHVAQARSAQSVVCIATREHVLEALPTQSGTWLPVQSVRIPARLLQLHHPVTFNHNAYCHFSALRRHRFSAQWRHFDWPISGLERGEGCGIFRVFAAAFSGGFFGSVRPRHPVTIGGRDNDKTEHDAVPGWPY